MREEKNNIYKELEALRSEVQNLKKQKEQTKDINNDEDSNIETSIKDFLDKNKINELIETIKKDYENMSPVTAIGLFTLGAIFARAISRR